MMFLLLACATNPPLPSSVPESSVPESSVPESSVPESSVPESSVPPAPEEPVIPAIDIIDKPIPFTQARKEMTREYLTTHWGAEHMTGDLEADITMTPRLIVLHWTAGPTAQGAWNTFSPERLPGRPELQRAGALNVSAHFVVDRDGTIWRLLPEDRVARHVIGLNHLSIGIENVGGIDGYPLTDAQLAANIDLVRYLTATWPDITHLIGHMEYQKMEGHPYFQETDPKYRTIKPDPGADFLAGVRAGVADLVLGGVPD